MSDGWLRARGVAATVGGAVVAISGVYLIGAYIYGVVQVLDEPDQSLIVWSIPILGMGIMLTAGGGTIFVLARKSLRGP